MAFKYVWRTSKRAKKTRGRSMVAVGEKPPLGEGERFSALSEALKKKGATNPNALAAWIGRKKYGKQKFQSLAARARRKLLSAARR